jgi:hypothetical protein
MQAYQNLKARLITEFGSDKYLANRIAAATTLDEILCALAESYRDWLLAAAQAANGYPTAALATVDVSDLAADAREKALLEVMSFFERDRAATTDVEVRRTGPRQLRVIRRQHADPANDAVHF